MLVKNHETQFEQSYERNTRNGVGVFKLLAATVIYQWTVILSNKTLYINFLIVFSILVTNVIPTEMPMVLCKRRIPLKKIFHEDIRKETGDNRKKMEEGFRVAEMRKCEWLQIKKQPEVSCFLKTLKLVTPKRKLCFEKILKGV